MTQELQFAHEWMPFLLFAELMVLCVYCPTATEKRVPFPKYHAKDAVRKDPCNSLTRGGVRWLLFSHFASTSHLNLNGHVPTEFQGNIPFCCHFFLKKTAFLFSFFHSFVLRYNLKMNSRIIHYRDVLMLQSHHFYPCKRRNTSNWLRRIS
jgi:hypothetical protein